MGEVLSIGSTMSFLPLSCDVLGVRELVVILNYVCYLSPQEKIVVGQVARDRGDCPFVAAFCCAVQAEASAQTPRLMKPVGDCMGDG